MIRRRGRLRSIPPPPSRMGKSTFQSVGHAAEALPSGYPTAFPAGDIARRVGPAAAFLGREYAPRHNKQPPDGPILSIVTRPVKPWGTPKVYASGADLAPSRGRLQAGQGGPAIRHPFGTHIRRSLFLGRSLVRMRE